MEFVETSDNMSHDEVYDTSNTNVEANINCIKEYKDQFLKHQ